ncbi:hypothetical protein [Paraburkholderia sp. A1RO-5L]|uniref:hypothetical protein n=1 Tax=unclassified Paraburkholderia TaxID=2615204 RepID=UPI003B80C87A
MVDVSKLKRKGLGAPPPIEEASPNLGAPETAPAPAPKAALAVAAAVQHEREDGRTLRASGRTLQFATRVTPEFDQRIRAVAKRDGLMLVQVLEKALDAYEASR